MSYRPLTFSPNRRDTPRAQNASEIEKKKVKKKIEFKTLSPAATNNRMIAPRVLVIHMNICIYVQYIRYKRIRTSKYCVRVHAICRTTPVRLVLLARDKWWCETKKKKKSKKPLARPITRNQIGIGDRKYI